MRTEIIKFAAINNLDMKITNKIIVVDLEATCWEDDGDYQRNHSEIIEIGICVLDQSTGEITQNKGILVKPEQSEISPFCKQLTTISQEMIDAEGVYLDEAVNELFQNYGSHLYTWASYGAYDKNMFRQQCKLKNIDYPFSDNHINVKELFREARGIRRSVGMKKALRMLNMNLDGTHHRGIDDAFNTAKILRWSLQ